MTTPPGRPPGPPPSGPPRSGAAAGAAAGGSGISPKTLVAIGLVVAIGVGVLVGVLVAGGDDEAKAEDVKLVSATEPGPNPFTPPVAPEAPPPNTLAPPSGPFGGTGDNTLCDREGIITFLTDPANSAQASEWARVVGIQVSEIPTYVRDLVPTTVTSDTRITNHTFENGKAVSFQAVLQAGTAVLVDVYGKPVVRCRCGNPLLPPRDIPKPTYTGTKWPGFDPTTIVVIQVTEVQIFPPGGVGEIPPQEEPEPEPDTGGGDGDEAIAILTAAFDECLASLADEGLTADQVSYTVAPGSAPDVYVVTITETSSGEFGSWSVNVETRDITPADPIAAEAGTICPNLA
ncbi:MAG: DUF6777 domain-containing protein [Actinomycetota bacterium]